jgi:hypothetical protein
MADGLPSLSGLNIPMPTGPGQLSITFPGGATLSATEGFDTGDPNTIVRSLMAQVGSALMPLQPFFMTLDVIIKILDTFNSIPKSITTLNPQPLIQAIVELTEAVAKLLGLIPQLSVPIMIKGILEAIITQMMGIRAEMQAQIEHATKLAEAEQAASQLGNAELQAVIQNARDNMAAQMQNFNASMGPMQVLVTLMNLLNKLAGLPEIGAMGSLGDSVGQEVLDAIDTIVDAMTQALQAIPV